MEELKECYQLNIDKPLSKSETLFQYNLLLKSKIGNFDEMLACCKKINF